MDYYSASNFCQSFGKQIVSMAQLGGSLNGNQASCTPSCAALEEKFSLRDYWLFDKSREYSANQLIGGRDDLKFYFSEYIGAWPSYDGFNVLCR